MIAIARQTKAVLLAAAIFLGGCAGDFMQIGYSTTYCCPGDYQNYHAWGLEYQDMPVFLGDYVGEEFEQAFAEKGLIRNDRLNDIMVTLRYRHVNLDPEQERLDPFERRIEEDVRLRYAATIEIDIHETDSGERVWAGQINRIHSVLPGEYMHEDRARPAFRAAFREALATYPELSAE